jgi:hypothetical protein
MTQKPSSGKSSQETRDDRLKAALKANMAKRKAQARARAAGAPDDGKDNKTANEGS